MNVGFRDIPLILAYRLLPFVVCAVFARRMRWTARLLVWAMFSAAIGVCVFLRVDIREVSIRGPIGLAYFTLISVTIHEVSRRVTRGKGANGLALLTCAGAYVLVPALAIPTRLMVGTVLLGWDASLSAFSYWMDTGRADAAPSRRECLFFILVNPSLVFSERGRKLEVAPAISWWGIGRVMLGIFGWTGQALVIKVAGELLVRTNNDAFALLLVTVSSAVALYLAHSSLASVQIGATRMVGHQVPERYCYPFLARSPEDFWRRWNRYAGGWVKKYVFAPSARILGGRKGRVRLSPRVAASLAVVWSFLVIGLLHQYVFWIQEWLTVRSYTPSFRVTGMFVGFGLIAIAWRAASGLVARFQAPSIGSSRLPKVAARCLALPTIAIGMSWMLVSCAGAI